MTHPWYGRMAVASMWLWSTTASAQTSPWARPVFCSGAGCCITGKPDPGKTCVRPDAVPVLVPDGVAMVHYVQIEPRSPKAPPDAYVSGGERVRFGLAREDGTIVVKPKYHYVAALSPDLLLAESDDGKILLLGPGGAETITPWLDVEAWSLGDIPVRFAVLARYDDGRRDIAPIRADGTLGPTIPSVVPDGVTKKAIVTIGHVAVVSVADALDGPRLSVFADVRGEVWAIPYEVVVYTVPSRAWAAGAEVPRNYVERRIPYARLRPSPMGAVGEDPTLLWPLTPAGAPERLPDGVLGFVPLDVRGPPILGPKEKSGRPDEVWTWAAVVRDGDRLTYRVAGGGDVGPSDLIARWSTLAPLSEVQIVYPRGSSGAVVVGRRSGDWAAFLSYTDYVGPTAQSQFGTTHRWAITGSDAAGTGPTPEAAAWDAVDRRQAEEADVRASRKAEQEAWARAAKAAAAAREKQREKLTAELRAWFEAQGTAPCGSDYRLCSQLESAAVELGDPWLTAWLARHDGFHTGLNAARACQISASACREATRIESAVAAYHAAEHAAREAAWDRAAAKTTALTNPQVDVTTYIDGAIYHQTMSMADYQALGAE